MLKRIYDLNTYFKNLYGHRVHKIAIDAGLSCPNRDGTFSHDGCIFCSPRGSGSGALSKGLDITAQVIQGKKAIVRRFKAKKFIAYFQSYSNTYAPPETLKHIYDQALCFEDVVGLSIGTRPDCVDEPVLSLLQEYARKYLVWIEYGLQSAHDATLRRINRGHDFKAFKDAVHATQNRGISICVHVILGLPGETAAHVKETARILADMGIHGIKLHLLYVVKNTALETLYRSGGYRCLEQGEYVDQVCDFLERTPKGVVIHRLTGDPHIQELVAPMWSLKKADTLDLIWGALERRDTWQGKCT